LTIRLKAKRRVIIVNIKTMKWGVRAKALALLCPPIIRSVAERMHRPERDKRANIELESC
jgi:hypothetical protein